MPQQDISSFSYFQSIGDVYKDFLQNQELELYDGDSSCEELEEDDFDASDFDFHDDSNFEEFLWPPKMLHSIEHSGGGSKRLRYCTSCK